MNGHATNGDVAHQGPLNEGNLVQALGAASSSNIQQIKSGTSQLQSWETSPGYFSLLQDAFIQTSLPIELRFLSLIQLKNGIDKYWRKSATNAITQEERSQIRARLIPSGLNEVQDKLANLNAISIAKIARYDFPTQWPGLMDDIMQLLRESVQPDAPPKQLSRILLITHHLIKELATIRLTRNVANFRAIAPTLFATLRELYLYKFQIWQNMLSSTNFEFNMEVVNHMNDNERILKIIRRLIVSGWEFPHQDDGIQDFWKTSISHMQLYMQMFHQEGLNNTYQLSAGRHLKQLAKLHVSIAHDHSVSFALLPDSCALVRHYWDSAKMIRQRQIAAPDSISEDYVTMYDGYNLRALLLLRACFSLVWGAQGNFKYRKSEATKEDPNHARELVKTELLSDAFILDLYDSIIQYFFYYLQSDIEEFTSEPEEWENKEEHTGDSFERSVRPCAERLFLDVTLHYKDLIIQPLLGKLASMCDPSQQNILIKDAAYSAIGVGAPMLHTKLDFNSFFTGTIVPELQRQGENHSILRRRIAILLAQWISLDVSPENRPLIYQIYQHLLDKSVPDNDETVRITAGKRFNDIAVAWEFDPAQFTQYGTQILRYIIDLIQEVSMIETKLALLNTIGTIIDAMDLHVVSSSDEIVALLPKLWNENNQENLMKQAIVTTLAKLVKSMRSESIRIHSVMLPTIKMAMDPTSESQVYLLDDSLELWSQIMRQTPETATSDDLLSMIPLVFPTYEMETEYIKLGLRITQSYAILAPSSLLQDGIRPELFNRFTTLLDVRKPDIIDDVCDILELLIRAADTLGGSSAVQVVAQALIQSGTLPRILDSIHADWETHQTTGPNRKDSPPDWKNETNYLLVLARILLVDSQLFISVLEAYAQARGMSTTDAIVQVLDEWFVNMDAVSSPGKKKQLCLALTKLLETGQPWILSRLQELMALWTSVCVEVRDDEKGVLSDTLVRDDPTQQGLGVEMEIPEDARKRKLCWGDVVHTVNVNEFVRYHLENVVNGVGGLQSFREEWLGNVDKDVVKRFEELEIVRGLRG